MVAVCWAGLIISGPGWEVLGVPGGWLEVTATLLISSANCWKGFGAPKFGVDMVETTW